MRCNSIPKELEIGFSRVQKLLPDTGDLQVAFEPASCLTLNLRDGVVVIGYSRK